MNFSESFLHDKRAALEKRFSFLNPQQQEAVFCVRGPLLILAGAGSGKTTVLINRIAYLLRYGNAWADETLPEGLTEDDCAFVHRCAEDGIAAAEDEQRFADLVAVGVPAPWSVLAITFTNKAAGELRERLQKAVGPAAEDIMASTFHSACVRILRRHAEEIGFASNFTIYDADDSQRVVKQILGEMNLDDKQFSPKTVKNHISAAKNDFILSEQYAASAGNDYFKEIVAKVYALYETRLHDNNALDFDDLLLRTVQLFTRCPEVLRQYQNRWRYVLVDEYQDTNMVQYRLVKLLAEQHGNLCVVGDDDQSIYRFRGATIENILSFEQNFPNTRVIRLEQNYRSTSNILNAANAVIAKNRSRKGKTLWTDRGDGEPISEHFAEDERGEAEYIAAKIAADVAAGAHYSDHAVLYRVNSLSNTLEKSLVRRGIPYRVFGGVRFYDHKEIKDVLAYLWLVSNPGDDLRLSRIINEPKRGIGATTLDTVRQLAAEQGRSLFLIIEHAGEYVALAGRAAPLKAFAQMLNELREMNEQGGSLAELYRTLLEKSGYLAMLEAGGIPEQGRLENVTELMSEIKKYEDSTPEPTLDGFLADCALMTDFDNYDTAADSVVLMTVHGAKGLEFDTVFVAGCEENIFPSYLSMSEPAEIEEERRLAYVAFTRAKRKLYLTCAKVRMLYGSTTRNTESRFVRDIPDAFKTVTGKEEPAARADTAAAHYATGFYGGYKRPAPTVGYTPTASAAPPRTKLNAALTVGKRVQHPTFGCGTILSSAKMGGDLLLEVAFDSCGTKRIMANFARLELL